MVCSIRVQWSMFYPFRLGLVKSIVRRDLQKLAVEKPYLSLSKVVATMLEGMNENMTADMVKDITAFILDKWENRATLNVLTKQELAFKFNLELRFMRFVEGFDSEFTC